MSLPLSHYLKDFSTPSASQASFSDTEFGELGSDPFDIGFSDEPAVAVDVEAEKRQAYAEGYEAAEREAGERHMAEIAELEAAHQRQLDELRERFDEQVTATVSNGLRSIAAEIAESVGNQTASVLYPLLDDLVTDKAIGNLTKMIEMAILSGEAASIVVRGPLPLFERLKAELPESPELLRHIEEPDMDLSVDLGETQLVTRLSAWTASVKKVVE